VPETVSELVTHYRKHELTEEKKAYATIEANSLYLANHIVSKWGTAYLQDVRTVDVKLWLNSLPFAPGTRSKIRNILSAVFNHAIRQEWTSKRRRSFCAMQIRGSRSTFTRKPSPQQNGRPTIG
jgi:hypothetical protein